MRQLDIFNPVVAGAFDVVVIGAGGLGSPIALSLAKMGVESITIYDPDVVEPHNIPNQLYRVSDIGRLKVEALADIMEELTGIRPKVVPDRVGGEPIQCGTSSKARVFISALDSMTARKEVFRSVLRSSPYWYIDTRMGGLVASIYSVNVRDREAIARYGDSLYSDRDTVPLPCAARAVWYAVNAAASVAAAAVKDIMLEDGISGEVHLDMALMQIVRVDW